MPIAIEGPIPSQALLAEERLFDKANGGKPTPQPTIVVESELDIPKEETSQSKVDYFGTVHNEGEPQSESLSSATNGAVHSQHLNGATTPIEDAPSAKPAIETEPKELVHNTAPPAIETPKPDDTRNLPDLAGKIAPPPPTINEIIGKILDVLARYRIKSTDKKTHQWVGQDTVATQIRQYLQEETVIQLVVPAFPFKSPNKISKVLGPLPDKAEEVALTHLNGLCTMIGEIYPPGAEITIVSDGLMYNDILGVTDLEVWQYGEALRTMARDKGCDHISFYRLRSLLDLEISETLTEETYLEQASQYRNMLIDRYTPAGFDTDQFIKESKDATLTYRGYIKFLEKDLEHDPTLAVSSNRKKDSEKIAKAMIARGKAFAAAIQQKFPLHIRLSIHASAADASKLSVSLIPQEGTCSMTPWHSALVRNVNGSIAMSHSLRVPALTHELIHTRDGRPSYFREKSPLFKWPGLDVTFDYIYPTGIIITPTHEADRGRYSIHNVQMQKVRGLAEKCSPIILRGFGDTNDERVFKAKAYDAGEVLPWTFGVMQKVKDAGRNDRMANNVVSSEAMPMHYDGMFKFVKKTLEDGTEVSESAPPRFQYFTAVSTAPPGSGYTLFANSRLFWQHLPAGIDPVKLKKLTWSCKNSGFWDNHMTNLPLVVPHPSDGTPCVRWHQPWPMWKTKFAHCIVEMENADQSYVELVDKMLYDRRVCLYLTWEKGDLVISDNFSMLHTRTAFDGQCERELWRIHFD